MADLPVFQAIPWMYMVIDEAHRLKNKHSRLFADLSQISTETLVLLTGTPLQNNVEVGTLHRRLGGGGRGGRERGEGGRRRGEKIQKHLRWIGGSMEGRPYAQHRQSTCLRVHGGPLLPVLMAPLPLPASLLDDCRSSGRCCTCSIRSSSTAARRSSKSTAPSSQSASKSSTAC